MSSFAVYVGSVLDGGAIGNEVFAGVHQFAESLKRSAFLRRRLDLHHRGEAGEQLCVHPVGLGIYADDIGNAAHLLGGLALA